MHLFDLLPGLIGSCFLGLVIGNFATSPIYRLPRNESLFIRDPYCGACNAPLLPRDLFPLLSWLMARGRCRYCSAPIPVAYAITEAVISLLFIVCYLRFGFSEQFILVSFGMTTLLMLGIMLSLDNFFSDKVLIACLICAMLYRTLQDGTIYNFAGDGYAGLLVGVVIWKLSGWPLTRDVRAFPEYLKLLVAAGMWLSLFQLCTVLLAMLMAMPFRKGRLWLREWVIIICVLSFILTRIAH